MVTLGVFVCMKTFELVLLCLFPPNLMFFIIDNINAEYIPSKFDNYLVVHEEPEHLTYFRTNISAWTVLYMETFFLSVNR